MRRACCKTLIQSSSLPSSLHSSKPYYLSNSSHVFPFLPRALPSISFNSSPPRAKLPGTFHIHSTPSNHSSSAALGVAVSSESAEQDEPQLDDPNRDTVEHLLTNPDDISRLMKMERRRQQEGDGGEKKRWFPYLDKFRCGNGACLSSGEVLEAMAPYMMEERKERFRAAVQNRTYSVCLVVEGLNDFGNVSATFRSADALGFQSVHVINSDSSKRYRDNRHVSMGAEKWLDIEVWDSAKECFQVLRSRGYRIATTHVGMDAVSVYDMDWSCPTAIVVGNEHRGISDEALGLSDLHCSIPMNGMVDSFNVSVAAGILMHHAVCDRTSRLGRHGDLTAEESKILLAEFSLRHSRSAISIVHEYAKRSKASTAVPKL